MSFILKKEIRRRGAIDISEVFISLLLKLKTNKLTLNEPGERWLSQDTVPEPRTRTEIQLGNIHKIQFESACPM